MTRTAIVSLLAVLTACATPDPELALDLSLKEARRVRHDMGRRLAAEALQRGDFARYVDKEHPKPSDGPDTRPWMVRNHADEWLTVRTTFDDDLGSMVRQVVRIMPGDNAEFDRITAYVRKLEKSARKSTKAGEVR